MHTSLLWKGINNQYPSIQAFWGENWGRKQPLVCILTFWNKGFGKKQPPIQSNPSPRKTLPPP